MISFIKITIHLVPHLITENNKQIYEKKHIFVNAKYRWRNERMNWCLNLTYKKFLKNFTKFQNSKYIPEARVVADKTN
ncbi:hypothetical protein BpHYR1_008856 [Brachionus plicatilis]|uniref:Uncharacterized protein n=1 Tax=Brachionus plicatilis TaxID=10195 RepID=A0A3M7ST09_BRAPC|nr:hypothetical protein BpHYR1_008856 [Brachionus plicatilis]